MLSLEARRFSPPKRRSSWGLSGVSSSPRPSIPARSLAVSAVTLWGIAERTPSARCAGGIVGHPGLCYVVAFSPDSRRVLAAAAGSGVPVAVAVMVSPVTVVSERTGDQASVRRGRSPSAWGLGCGRPNYWGPRKGRDPAVAGVPWREAVAVKPPAPQTRGALPPRAPGSLAGGRGIVGT